MKKNALKSEPSLGILNPCYAEGQKNKSREMNTKFLLPELDIINGLRMLLWLVEPET